MLYLIEVCGPSGWGLLLASAIVVGLVIRTVWQTSSGRGAPPPPALVHARHAILFWGGMAAILGFLGQCAAIHAAMTAIIPAESISPDLIDQGFSESFIPSFWGFGILSFSALAWAGLGHWHRRRLAIGVLLMLLGTWSCASPDRPIPTAITEGAWVGPGGADDICLVFRAGDEGKLQGEAITLRDGRQQTQCPMTEVRWETPSIEARMATGVVYKGEVDLANGEARGALYYKGEPTLDLDLRWHPSDAVGGLLARTSVPSYGPPPDCGDGWRTAEVEIVGWDRAAVEGLIRAVATGEAGYLHSLLIAKRGTLVVEEYFHGYGRDDLHRTASVTKSISSLLVGLARDQGSFASLDVPIGDFFPRLAGTCASEWEAVSLRHLLTMSMGLDWTEEEREHVHGTGEAFFEQVLSRAVVDRPGEIWRYTNPDVNLLAGVIKHATGQHADAFAREHLFEPLGIEVWSWDYGQQDGYRLMDGSLQLRPRDMAKLGALVLERGRWADRQILSETWIEESTAEQIPADQDAYGYLWWIFDLPTPRGPERMILANGWGSQFIAIFPELEMVLVTTGSNEDNGRHFDIGRLIAQYLLSSPSP